MGGDQLIHISSTAKHTDQSFAGNQASKAGVVALAYATIDEERGDNVRVSVIDPEMTDSPLVLRRPMPTPCLVTRTVTRAERTLMATRPPNTECADSGQA